MVTQRYSEAVCGVRVLCGGAAADGDASLFFHCLADVAVRWRTERAVHLCYWDAEYFLTRAALN